MKIYRAMTPDTDGLPQIGGRPGNLGFARLTGCPIRCQCGDPDDTVNPGEGMSAAPNDPANLGKNRRPPQLNGGTGKDPVWEIDTKDLGPNLEYVQDKPTHGVAAARVPMTLAEFEHALAATRPRWVRVIG